ncbi:MAG: PIN domain-containing protein [Verrucomicrobia bacterium]|nr:PIN domain-containing protein [Verrucomicrobiota bacterium]
MTAYADTSFVISWFVPDANHAAAIAHLYATKGPARLPWTPWNALEFNNSVRALTARGVLSAASLKPLAAQVRSAIGAGDLVATPLPAYRWWLKAESLSHAHTVQLNVRTLDLLHVAAASLLGAREFWTFGQRQRTLATASGLKVGP